MPVLNDAKALYLGDRSVSAVYLGDRKVWPSSLTFLPSPTTWWEPGTQPLKAVRAPDGTVTFSGTLVGNGTYPEYEVMDNSSTKYWNVDFVYAYRICNLPSDVAPGKWVTTKATITNAGKTTTQTVNIRPDGAVFCGSLGTIYGTQITIDMTPTTWAWGWAPGTFTEHTVTPAAGWSLSRDAPILRMSSQGGVMVRACVKNSGKQVVLKQDKAKLIGSVASLNGVAGPPSGSGGPTAKGTVTTGGYSINGAAWKPWWHDLFTMFSISDPGYWGQTHPASWLPEGTYAAGTLEFMIETGW